MKKYIIVICFFSYFIGNAQDWTPPAESPGFGDSNNDAGTNAPSTPINSIEGLLLITGLVVGVIYYKRNKKAVE